MTPVTPMLASVGDDIPRGEGWVFEPKYDGIRILAFVSNGKASLVSRNGLDKTRQFPEVAEALAGLHRKVKRPFVVDGEIVVMQGDSPLRFQELQSRMHVNDRLAIEGHRDAAPAALIVFDLLLDGKNSLVTESWRVRRKHLAALLRPPGAYSNALRLSDVSEDGDAMLAQARARDWEGIIAKRVDATYEAGRRSSSWLKLKIERRQELVIGGWTEPRNSREHFGAILLGYYNEDGQLVYAGHTGTGFTRKSLAETYAKLRRLEQPRSPFSTTPRTNQPAHWTRPELVAEIKFNEWTTDGKLRQPVFLGIRDDKSPREVTLEPQSGRVRAKAEKPAKQAAATTRKRAATAAKKTTRTAGAPLKAASPRKRARPASSRESGAPQALVDQLEAIERSGGDGVIDVGNGTLEVSNLDKVFFPKTKQTKGDVMRFYARMSPYILPALADRPLVMKRFPNGVTGKAFYQQKAPADPPPAVRVESVSDEGITTANRIIGGDLATLLYITQLGAISIDPWHSRVESIQYADYSIIDLDPGPKATFGRVVEVALAVKDVLDELDLHAVPKTSGASGIHIVLPLAAKVPNDGARMIAELVATRVAEKYPKLATIERWVQSRPSGAIYVDFLQNIRGKTVAGVYSVRAQSSPTVSTPLQWDEVDSSLDPTGFTIDNVPERVREIGDLWAKGMKTPNSLDGILRGAKRRG